MFYSEDEPFLDLQHEPGIKYFRTGKVTKYKMQPQEKFGQSRLSSY